MTDQEIEDLTDQERRGYVEGCLERISESLMEYFPSMRKRALLGGAFGASGFVMASQVSVDAGLHRVTYYVFTEHGLFLGMGDTKAVALEQAREILRFIQTSTSQTLLAKFRARIQQREKEQRQRIEAAQAEIEAERKKAKAKLPSIPRRRQRIFDESEGKCHYCATPLTLDGKWHIEHKMPKALGGGNEPGNLVASCVTCNHKKRDTTDIEFKARMAKGSAPSLPVKEQA